MRTPLITLEELSKIKSISLTALYKRRNKKPFPNAIEPKIERSSFNGFTSKYKKIYYKKDELLAWFDETSRKVKA